MNLQDFAKPLVAKNHFVKASFGGFAGSGKTRTASEFVVGSYKDMECKKPILLIDNEKGSRFLIPFFKEHGIECLVKDTVELADVLQSFEYLQKAEIDFLFIDSLSKVWYKYVRDYRSKNKLTFMTLQDWGKILPDWQEKFSDRFVSLDGNVVFTGRGGFTYEKEEDQTNEEGKVTKKGAFVKSGVKMKLAGETPFEPDLNVWMELEQDITDKGLQQWREAQVMKDRSAIIDGKVFKNPSYKDFQPVVKYLLGMPTGNVSGASSTQNLAPSEDYEYQKRKNAKEIELEKIKAEFDKAGFGTSKEDKQLKIMIAEKVFGTSSWTEVEKKDAVTLAPCREILQQFFINLATDKPENPIEYVKGYNFTLDAELPEFLQAKKG